MVKLSINWPKYTRTINLYLALLCAVFTVNYLYVIRYNDIENVQEIFEIA